VIDPAQFCAAALKNILQEKNLLNPSFELNPYEIQSNSEQIFICGAENKGETPPLLKRANKKMPEEPEFHGNKPETQVLNPLREGAAQFFVSDDPEKFRHLGQTFLGHPLPKVEKSSPSLKKKSEIFLYT
jgi:hypothetical protein